MVTVSRVVVGFEDDEEVSHSQYTPSKLLAADIVGNGAGTVGEKSEDGIDT